MARSAFCGMDSTPHPLPQRSYFCLSIPHFNKWYHKLKTKSLIPFTLTLLPNSYLANWLYVQITLSVSLHLPLSIFPSTTLNQTTIISFINCNSLQSGLTDSSLAPCNPLPTPGRDLFQNVKSHAAPYLKLCSEFPFHLE